MGELELESFRKARRQKFLDPASYEESKRIYEEEIADTELRIRRNTDIKKLEYLCGLDVEDKFVLFSLRYTAGEPLDKLRQHFEDVVAAYERYAKYLREYHQEPDWPAFSFTHIDDYVRLLALLSLAILLRRADLIPRIHNLVADSGFDEQDCVYETLLGKFLPNRPDPDYWYHDYPYGILIDVTLGDTPEESIEFMQSYLKNWYKYMKGCGWYDSHKNQGPEGGGYFGYWAWEAAAVAYLYDLDDTSFRDHLVYPKDLVAFARQHAPLDQEQLPAQYRVLPGEPCPKTGEWMVGHTPRTARRFTKGEMMPELNLDTGATIWMFVRD